MSKTEKNTKTRLLESQELILTDDEHGSVATPVKIAQSADKKSTMTIKDEETKSDAPSNKEK